MFRFSLLARRSVLFANVVSGVAFAAPPPASQSASAPAETLRSSAERRELLIGTSVLPERLFDRRYTSVLSSEFNLIAPEYVMKWALIHPQPDVWVFEPADRMVAFAGRNGMKVKGHALLWHEELPDYVTEAMTPDELRAAIREHIATLVGRYKGQLWAWDVVNEPIDDQDGFRKTIFYRTLGEAFIADALRLAHEADPACHLILNDYDCEGLNPKSDRLYALVKGLVERGVPLHGVGFQMHITPANAPKPEDLQKNFARFAALGLKLHISEMDVRMREAAGERAEKLELQGRVYRGVIAACVAAPGVKSITFWGFTDRYSWIDGYFGPDDPLLWDENYERKPAYFGVREALR